MWGESVLEREFRTPIILSQAIWDDPKFAKSQLEELVTYLALRGLSPQKTSQALTRSVIERALVSKKNAQSTSFRPFHKLSELERLVLFALHHASMNYQTLATFVHLSTEQLGVFANKTRMLASRFYGIPYPRISEKSNIRCPEYNTDNPWPQRFLDDSIPADAQVFFQNHLMACDSCRHILDQWRKFYYLLEKNLPKPLTLEPIPFEKILKTGFQCSDLKKITFLRSIVIFVKNNKLLIALALAGLVSFYFFNS